MNSDANDENDGLPFSLEQGNCYERIRRVEAMLEKGFQDVDLESSIRRKLEQAKRFLRSDEYGACCYELDRLDKHIP